MNGLIKVLVILLSCASILACSSRQMVYQQGSEGSQAPVWVQKVKPGETLEVTLIGESKPQVLKLAEVNETSILGTEGEQIRLAQVDKVKTKKNSAGVKPWV